jgi:alpha-tubulin suppressor-like RCC1 family protein
MRYLGGFITASYNPLKVPNAPTIGTVTAGNAQVSVAFTAPSNVGGSAITSYIVLVRDSSTGATFTGTGSASPIVVTGLTNGQTYTAQVAAVNSYGPSAFSAASGSFSYAPRLFSWGSNGIGQLGQNDVANRSSPVQVGSLTDWAQFSTGSNFSAAVKTNGTLWTWGFNNRGQLGQITVTNLSSPVQVGALTDWARVTGGDVHCAAIKTSGTLWTWGDNGSGRLGQNIAYNINRSSPVQVGSLTDWARTALGSSFSLAIKTNGTLWSWGFGANGQLGLNDTANRSSPVQVGALTDWSQVTAGDNFTIAVKTTGTLWSWGFNGSGQLGRNNYGVSLSSPAQVGALTNWTSVSAGYDFCVAVKSDGTIWSWGVNSSGQLGLNYGVFPRSSPTQIGALTDWSQVSSGRNFCRAIKTNSTIWSWGSNASGRLGQNIAYSINQSSPVQVGSLATWSLIGQGFGANHTLASQV